MKLLGCNPRFPHLYIARETILGFTHISVVYRDVCFNFGMIDQTMVTFAKITLLPKFGGDSHFDFYHISAKKEGTCMQFGTQIDIVHTMISVGKKSQL